MLESFVILKTDSRASPVRHDAARIADCSSSSPEKAIRDLGFRVYVCQDEAAARATASKANSVILCTDQESLELWIKRVSSWRSWPVIWWCDYWNHGEGCLTYLDADGLLLPSMSSPELHGALIMASSHYLRRTQWEKEREQLLGRLEERKWIERAKAVLCELKGISETEAYDLLRKQAMNERKRMADVASGIVKVYQLITDNRQGGKPT
jgi:two-component system, response regulator / RNA-binding antiterminator